MKKHIKKAQDDWNGSRLMGGGDAITGFLLWKLKVEKIKGW